MVGEISMIGSGEKILGWHDLGPNNALDSEEVCVAPRCGRPATRWIPSHIDGKLIPACDKHYRDPKMTPRRWENSRKRCEDEIRGLIGKKCYYCGGQAITSMDLNQDAAFEKWGNEFIDNEDIRKDYVPNIVWECKACALARLDD